MRRMIAVASFATLVCYPGTSTAPSSVAGSYAVWLCRSACSAADSSTASVTGVLVLFDAPVTIDTLTDLDFRKPIRNSTYLLDRSQSATACFRLTRRTREIDVLAGTTPVGFTNWKREGDVITTALYGSPDAFYTIRARLKGERLSSAARESGVIFREFDVDAGVLHGVRVGPPDLNQCRPR